jgi:hypothetical protein
MVKKQQNENLEAEKLWYKAAQLTDIIESTFFLIVYLVNLLLSYLINTNSLFTSIISVVIFTIVNKEMEWVNGIFEHRDEGFLEEPAAFSLKYTEYGGGRICDKTFVPSYKFTRRHIIDGICHDTEELSILWYYFLW